MKGASEKLRPINLALSLLLVGVLFTTSGCAKNKNLERIAQEQAATIQSLNNEINRLNQELDQSVQAREELANAKAELESKLKSEVGAGDVSLSLEERGLVVTVLNKVLFDSGKAELKDSAVATLATVGGILEKRVEDHLVFVEGHTDNVPIKYSGWKSNWELSTARATEVIHQFIDKQGMIGERFAAIGYGQFHPVASNDSAEGREQNRRVEIVISPKRVKQS